MIVDLPTPSALHFALPSTRRVSELPQIAGDTEETYRRRRAQCGHLVASVAPRNDCSQVAPSCGRVEMQRAIAEKASQGMPTSTQGYYIINQYYWQNASQFNRRGAQRTLTLTLFTPLVVPSFIPRAGPVILRIIF
jgi:hypothetical protein